MHICFPADALTDILRFTGTSFAHEDRRSSRGLYNKAEYADQRRHMMQEWADMIDGCAVGESRKPNIIPESMAVYAADPSVG